MTGRAEFRAVPKVGSALVMGLTWFVDASVPLWQRCSGRLTRAATWASDTVDAVRFLAFLTLAVVGGVVLIYVIGILGIYTRETPR